MTIWNPDQYLKFANKRTRPALDLATQIGVESPKRIIDLGCGTGTSTTVLASKWPDAEITGQDSSAEMLEKARTENPELKWEQSDLHNWTPDGNYDVIFSNATLQWVNPVEPLLTSCMESLNPGGAFAFQVPNNLSSPYHLCIIEVAKLPQWAEKTKDVINPLRYDSMGFYYDVLTSLSSGVDAWETCYFQIMDDAESIVEWVTGTGLRPYLQALDTDDEREQFKADLLVEYQKSFAKREDGKVIFPFNRQFVIAYR